MGKNFKQELADLESGLVSLQNTIKEAKDRRKYNRALILVEVQEARIDFFKKGYNMRNRELKEQQALP